MKTQQVRLLSQRMRVDYPWPVWAIGWLAILKAFIWLGAEPPALPANQMTLMGYKYALFMLPLFFCGIGAWNMKKWAAWGLVGLAVADLLFYLTVPSVRASLALNTTSSVAYTFSITVFAINGPPSTILILLLSPALMKRLNPSS
ncbi:MAG: hypothetical protein AB1724_10940 [Thermodesulfobacteriota bacterium]